ncbi:hypothetical protein P8452_42540 [Trifolium repens]|nr:hypothetical protein P8452_42540 [Trifolium repens]
MSLIKLRSIELMGFLKVYHYRTLSKLQALRYPGKGSLKHFIMIKKHWTPQTMGLLLNLKKYAEELFHFGAWFWTSKVLSRQRTTLYKRALDQMDWIEKNTAN